MTRETKISIGILIVGLFSAVLYWFIPISVADKKTNKAKAYNEKDEIIILPKNIPEVYQNIPEVQSYLSDLRELMSRGESVLPLQRSEIDNNAQKAQKILLKNAEFLKDTKQGDKILHNDMMRILPAIISTLDANAQKICQSHTCYQAQKYNYVTNATTRAIVDIDDEEVISIQYYPDMQPDISLRLTRIAQAIALNAPEVRDELGFAPSKKDMAMANVRGALQESPCENSDHLCVAPTFSDHKNARALWAIIDLTELKLAAAKWAGLGKTTTPACISERSLQNRYIMKKFCQKDTELDRDGWKFRYRITGSDGLEVVDASFKGQKVIQSIKTVDWHVSYQQEGAENLDTSVNTYIEGRLVEYVIGEDGNFFFGYNDAMGCPMFSTSVVLPFNGPQVGDIYNDAKAKIGFYLTQDYRNPKWPMACNYRYENRYEFYDDGSFRVLAINKGRGCGDNAVYRPVMRIDMALGGKEKFYQNHGDWEQWKIEQLYRDPKEAQDSQTSSYLYKIVDQADSSRGYYIEPNHGQFGDGSRGDYANMFASKHKPNEGDYDLLTLGSCCKLDEDGVERYIEDNESIDGENIVLWYVPYIRNDAREGHEYCWADTVVGADGNLEVKMWPCIVGPKFVPIELEIRN